MHVVFLAPHFPAGQRRFVAGLKAVGARVTGMGEPEAGALPAELRALLDDYERVSNVTDVDALTAGLRAVQRRGPWVHRFEATIEAHMLPAAHAREACGVPGLSVDVARRCRDKVEMKAFLGERGFPVARQAPVDAPEDLRRFCAAQGYPVILKPRDGAGAQATFRIGDDAELARAIAESGLERGRGGFTVEQFLDGHEGFFDTLTVGGEVAFEAICHYFPNVLPAMRDRSVSPQIVTTNRIDAPGYAELRQFGRRVVAAMGIETSPTHMEWFFGGQGLKFSEIGARPPGCNVWDIYTEVLGHDLYTEWARAVCWGDTQGLDGPRRAGGLVSVRPDRDGRIAGYEGLDAIQHRWGRHIFKAHLPPAGTPTQPVEAGYLANAWVKIAAEDYDQARHILDDIGATLKVRAV